MPHAYGAAPPGVTPRGRNRTRRRAAKLTRRGGTLRGVAALVRDFPLFPLGLVALPSELVPLHIFEERYKTMMARVLEEEGEFGIVWVADDGLRPIGCACEIAEVLERMPDGRLNLVARGTRAFRIEARQDELAYPAGTVEFLPDRDEAIDEDAAGEAHEVYADLVEQATDRAPDPEEVGAMSRLPDGRDGGVRDGGQAGVVDLRSETARFVARGAPVPRGDQAARLHRARGFPSALERLGPLRQLSSQGRGRRARAAPRTATDSPARAMPSASAPLYVAHRPDRRRVAAGSAASTSSSCWAAACSAVKPPAWGARPDARPPPAAGRADSALRACRGCGMQRGRRVCRSRAGPGGSCACLRAAGAVAAAPPKKQA